MLFLSSPVDLRLVHRFGSFGCPRLMHDYRKCFLARRARSANGFGRQCIGNLLKVECEPSDTPGLAFFSYLIVPALRDARPITGKPITDACSQLGIAFPECLYDILAALVSMPGHGLLSTRTCHLGELEKAGYSQKIRTCGTGTEYQLIGSRWAQYEPTPNAIREMNAMEWLSLTNELVHDWLRQ